MCIFCQKMCKTDGSICSAIVSHETNSGELSNRKVIIITFFNIISILVTCSFCSHYTNTSICAMSFIRNLHVHKICKCNSLADYADYADYADLYGDYNPIALFRILQRILITAFFHLTHRTERACRIMIYHTPSP